MLEPLSQPGYDVRFGWGADALDALGPDAAVIVIVDVLSFTTRVERAVTAGSEVLPLPPGHDGKAYAERHGAEIGGLALGAAADRPGRRLVIMSPNGAALSFAARDRGGVVIAGCLRNASAVARAARSVGGPVTVIAAGERWGIRSGPLRPALEDALGAGAIIAAHGGTFSPEAAHAAAGFTSLADQLPQLVAACASGRELAGNGRESDVALAAEHDVSTTVPVLRDGAYVSATLAS